MPKSTEIYNTLVQIINHRKNKEALIEPDKVKFCFMLHDEVLNEIQKIELTDLSEWMNDGSFEKTDKLYISFLINEF